MMRFLFAAVAALSFVAAQPVLACEDCKNCPQHKTAQADKKPDADKVATCGCPGGEKGCKCGEKCACSHCSAHKGGAKKEKEEGKKS